MAQPSALEWQMLANQQAQQATAPINAVIQQKAAERQHAALMAQETQARMQLQQREAQSRMQLQQQDAQSRQQAVEEERQFRHRQDANAVSRKLIAMGIDPAEATAADVAEARKQLVIDIDANLQAKIDTIGNVSIAPYINAGLATLDAKAARQVQGIMGRITALDKGDGKNKSDLDAEILAVINNQKTGKDVRDQLILFRNQYLSLHSEARQAAAVSVQPFLDQQFSLRQQYGDAFFGGKVSVPPALKGLVQENDPTTTNPNPKQNKNPNQSPLDSTFGSAPGSSNASPSAAPPGLGLRPDQFQEIMENGTPEEKAIAARMIRINSGEVEEENLSGLPGIFQNARDYGVPFLKELGGSIDTRAGQFLAAPYNFAHGNQVMDPNITASGGIAALANPSSWLPIAKYLSESGNGPPALNPSAAPPAQGRLPIHDYLSDYFRRQSPVNPNWSTRETRAAGISQFLPPDIGAPIGAPSDPTAWTDWERAWFDKAQAALLPPTSTPNVIQNGMTGAPPGPRAIPTSWANTPDWVNPQLQRSWVNPPLLPRY